jgi:hypothetical protein
MSASQAASCFGPGVLGAIFGLVSAFMVAALASRYSRRYAGRSDSARHGNAFAGCAGFLTFVAITLAVALLVDQFF